MKPDSQKRTILFSGMVAADPYQGGATWAVLQYVLGLRQLGHDVYFVEPVKEKALRPAGVGFGETDNARYFRQVMQDFGLEGSAALLREGSKESIGLSYSDLLDAARRADLLFNVSGMLTDEAILGEISRRVYLDLDPAFIQLWHSVYDIDMRFTAHTHFVSVGMALGTASCPVPLCGLSWITTPQPVVLAFWPRAEAIKYDGLTTIANWRGYGSVEFEGQHYGQKAHSLRGFFPLPKMTREKFLLALAIHPDEKPDVAALADNDWKLLDPAELANTPDNYRRFIQDSKAEFGLAKSGYVLSRCGWFSDRSCCYLASGRPVIAQETGFSDFFPVGQGLFSFRTSEDVLAAIESLNRDYSGHARAARDLAETYFDSNKVLASLLERIEVA